MRAYSLDLRRRVLADCDAGLTTKRVAYKYSVSASWVRRLKQRRRQNGEIAPRRRYNPRRPLAQTHADLIRRAVEARPDATLAELREALGLSASLPTLCRALRALRLSFKKKFSARPSRIARTSRRGGRSGG